jgi:hypothetical protein
MKLDSWSLVQLWRCRERSSCSRKVELERTINLDPKSLVANEARQSPMQNLRVAARSGGGTPGISEQSEFFIFEIRDLKLSLRRSFSSELLAYRFS